MRPDMIEFSQVAIANSPDVSKWPITSDITKLGLHTTGLVIEHTKAGQWPAVPFETTTQEATLWIFLHIGGRWYGSGVERIRPGQTSKPEGAPSSYARNWYYDANRWGVMTAHQPAPGELVGFCVVAGDTRGAGNIAVQERSGIVLVSFPADAGADYPPFASAEPVPTPAPPVAPPALPLSDDEIVQLLDDVHRIAQGFESFMTAASELAKQIDNIVANGVKVHL